MVSKYHVMQDQRTELTFDFNLAGLQAGLLADLQRLGAIIPTALAAPMLPADAPALLRGSQITYFHDPTAPAAAPPIQDVYTDWVLRSGFKELIELILLFVERVRTFGAVLNLLQDQKADGHLPGPAVQKALKADATRFHRAGLPERLQHLEATYRLTLPPDVKTSLLSLNKARNCLVHRGGVISKEDLTDGQSLVLTWVQFQLLLRDEDGERPAVIGAFQAKAAEVFLRRSLSQKRFPAFSRVVLTPEEFADITWSLAVTGIEFAAALRTRAEAEGLSFT